MSWGCTFAVYAGSQHRDRRTAYTRISICAGFLSTLVSQPATYDCTLDLRGGVLYALESKKQGDRNAVIGYPNTPLAQNRNPEATTYLLVYLPHSEYLIFLLHPTKQQN